MVIIILIIIYFKEILHNNHIKKKRKKRSLQDIKESPSSSWSVDIPNELLLKIFWHGVRSFGAMPFLCRYNYCVYYYDRNIKKLSYCRYRKQSLKFQA